MVGQTLAHYRILERLGAGGMGVVYKALDAHLNRTVAIKVLPAEAVADPVRHQRFVQEARAASALDHPNIVTIYDIAEAEGQHFIVMQYVAGKTLREIFPRSGLPLDDVLRYAVQIADALAQAHARGIVHRDLKPENIMVTEQGQVKILDFGLAKLMEPPDYDESAPTESMKPHGPLQTEEGAILGTVAYMSPEQAEGKKLDARSDIFSFGSVLYEAVTGRRGFHGETKISILSAILHKDPQPVSEIVEGVPGDLEKIIARCLRKDPARRFQHMDDLKVALEDLKEEAGSATAISGAQARIVKRPGGRVRQRAWASALFALVLVVGAVWFHFARTGEPAAPPPKTIPFTSFPGIEQDPAFSPDGNQLAFVWNGERQDNFDIYVKLIGTGTPLRLTTDPALDASPAWSPDGRHVAFLRKSKGGDGIYMVPSLGGPERKLAQSAAKAYGLAWSPDGKFLAIVDKSSPQDPSSIFLLSTETGEKRRLTSPPAQKSTDWFPRFSPDGQTLAFTRFRGSEAIDIYLLSMGSGTARGEARRLTFDQRAPWGLDWTPDGRSIVFSAVGTGGRSLWRIAASGGTSEPVAVAGDNASYPSISRRGGRLAYVQFVWYPHIWRIASPSWKGRATAAKENASTKLIASTGQMRAPSSLRMADESLLDPPVRDTRRSGCAIATARIPLS